MRLSLRGAIAIGIVLTSTQLCSAADLQISVVDSAGQAVKEVVFIATPMNPTISRTKDAANSSSKKPAIMDQLNKEFVPEALVVSTGTQVLFPNSDAVAHQVYSFSQSKRFALPLYRHRPYPPVTFDQPGIVTLGCNIHDHMVGYIVVSDSPYFGQSGVDGRLTLRELPQGAYRVSAWHPRFSESVAEQSIVVGDTSSMSVTFHLTKALRPARRPSTDRIRDY